MPPQVALLICAAVVSVALIVDSRRTPIVSNAVWLPIVWVAILASRPVVNWFDPSSATLNADPADGSPLDATILSLLMTTAAVILIRRNLQWQRWIRGNTWIVAIFLYFAVSIVWSDFPTVAAKRWIRALGSLMVILVILSEDDPVAAIATVVRRCAYILVPFSVALIKYYRHMAVEYNAWTGEELLVGVTTDKNALGRLCMISGLFALWELITIRQNTHIHADALNRLLGASVFAVTLWLLHASHSATSLASFLLGCCVLVTLGLPPVRRRSRYLGTMIVLTTAAVVILSLSLNLPEMVITSLGRDMTLTDRTHVWGALLDLDINPIIGVGYDSFWLGPRLENFVRVYKVNEAHNGYLEVYLELGIVGLFLFAGMVLSMFARAKRSLRTDVAYGRLRLAVLAVFLVYNVTEAGYKPTTFICFALLLVAIEVPAMRMPRTSAATAAASLASAARPKIGFTANDSRQASGERPLDDGQQTRPRGIWWGRGRA